VRQIELVALTKTLSNEEIQLANMLDGYTRASAKDVVIEPERLIFVVRKGDLGKAVGRNGANAERMQKLLSKRVEFVEEGNNVEEFTTNLLYPATVKEVLVEETDGRKALLVKVDPKSKGVAIGKGGERIKRAKMLLKRFYGIEELKVV
jgi:N utilization substance protein A